RHPAAPSTCPLSLPDALPISLDGVANQAGFFGVTPVGQQAVTGDRSTGEALQSLLAGLAALGLISDTSTSGPAVVETVNGEAGPDRKSTRLNSSHVKISYAVF